MVLRVTLRAVFFEETIQYSPHLGLVPTKLRYLELLGL